MNDTDVQRLINKALVADAKDAVRFAEAAVKVAQAQQTVKVTEQLQKDILDLG